MNMSEEELAAVLERGDLDALPDQRRPVRAGRPRCRCRPTIRLHIDLRLPANLLGHFDYIAEREGLLPL